MNFHCLVAQQTLRKNQGDGDKYFVVFFEKQVPVYIGSGNPAIHFKPPLRYGLSVSIRFS